MTTDAFQLLGLPRRAALGEDEVRAAFQKAGAAVHPDAAASESERADRTGRFTALNEAAATLSSLPRRLRHLLELEHPAMAGARTGAAMDGAMMDLFSVIATAVRGAVSVQAKKQNAGSALARAMLAGEEMAAQEALEAAAQKIEAARAAFESELLSLDPADGAALASCAARAAFLEKWQAQVREAFAGFFGA